MRVINDSIDFTAYLKGPDESAKVQPASAWVEEVVERFNNPPFARGAMLPWPKTHSLIRMRSSEVTLWAGLSGSGKTMLVCQTALSLVAQGEKVCIASMEMRPAATMERMTRQGTATGAPDLQSIRDFARWTDGRLYLYDQMGMVHPDRLLAVMRYTHEKLGVTHFIIDNLLKCSLAEEDYTGQKAFLDRICAHARDTGQHIHLIAHSRKPKDENAPPRKYDVRGSGTITDQVDNVVVVYRNKSKEEEIASGQATAATYKQFDCLLIVDKQRHFEWEGKIQLWFDRASLNYLQTPDERPVPIYTTCPDDPVEL